MKAYNFEEIIINLFKTKVCKFYCIEYLTRGPVETAYVGTSFLDNPNESIVFLDNDNIYNLVLSLIFLILPKLLIFLNRDK